MTSTMVACSSAQAKTDGLLTVFSSSTSMNLDPAKSQSLPITSEGLVTRRLTAWETFADKPTDVIPDIATDTGQASDGGKTWTYKLKPDIKYQTGEVIKSGDIKYGIERSFAPELSGGLSYHKTLLVGGDTYKGPYEGKSLDSIETPDDSTIVFHLKQPYADWPWIAAQPAFSPVPKSADTDPSKYSPSIVSSGPYQVDNYQEGVALELVKNKYWDPKTDQARTGNPDRITFQLGQNDSTAAQSVQQSLGPAEFGFLGDMVPPAQQVDIRADEGAAKRMVTSQSGALLYLALNTQSEALQNGKVRQAFQYAVDKKAFRVATGGTTAGNYATTLITEGIEGRTNFDLYPAPPTGDTEKAKQLLSEGGYKGQTLTLLTKSDNTSVTQAEAIEYGLKQAGINVTIKPMDEDAFEGVVTGDDPTQYDLATMSWQADYPSANANIEPLFASSQIGGGGENVSRYSNQAVDAAIVQAQGTLDVAAANKEWTEIDKMILSDSPAVPLIFTHRSFIAGSGVGDFQVPLFPGYPNYLKVTVNNE